MTKRNWTLVAVALALGVIYACFFTDWFKTKSIRILYTLPPFQTRFSQGGSPAPAFGFSHPFKLTEIKVVPLAEFQTNSRVLPLWHLVSDSNSAPIKFFFYGARIRGLKPEVPGARPQPLQTNVAYRILITAGKIKGQHDFIIGGAPGETNSASR